MLPHDSNERGSDRGLFLQRVRRLAWFLASGGAFLEGDQGRNRGGEIAVRDQWGVPIKTVTGAGPKIVSVNANCASLHPIGHNSFFVLNKVGAVIPLNDGPQPHTEYVGINQSTSNNTNKILSYALTPTEMILQVRAQLMVHSLPSGGRLVVRDTAGNEQSITSVGPVWTRRFLGSAIDLRCRVGNVDRKLKQCPTTVIQFQRFGYQLHAERARIAYLFEMIQAAYRSDRAGDFIRRLTSMRELLPVLEPHEGLAAAEEYTSYLDKFGAEGLEWVAMFLTDALARIGDDAAFQAFQNLRAAYMSWHDEQACGRPKANMNASMIGGMPALGGANARPMAYLSVSEIDNETQLKHYRAASYAALILKRLNEVAEDGGAGLGYLRADNGRCGEYELPQAYIPVEIHPLAIPGAVLLDKDSFRARHLFVGPGISDADGKKQTVFRLHEISSFKDQLGPSVARDALTCLADVAVDYDSRIEESAFHEKLQKSVRGCVENSCTFSGGLTANVKDLLDLDTAGGMESLCSNSKAGLGQGNGPGSYCADALQGYGISGVDGNLCRFKLPTAEQLHAILTGEMFKMMGCLEAIRETANPPSNPLALWGVTPGVQSCAKAAFVCILASSVPTGGADLPVATPVCVAGVTAVCVAGYVTDVYDSYTREPPPPTPGQVDDAVAAAQAALDEAKDEAKEAFDEAAVDGAEVTVNRAIVSKDGRTAFVETKYEWSDGSSVHRIVTNKCTDSTSTNGADCGSWGVTKVEEKCDGDGNCEKTTIGPDGTPKTEYYKKEEGRPDPTSEGGPLPEACADVDDNRFNTVDDDGDVDPLPPDHPDAVSCHANVQDAFVANGEVNGCDTETVNCNPESECCCGDSGGDYSRPPQECPVSSPCPPDSVRDWETCGCKNPSGGNPQDPPYPPVGL